jgi:hypothetical protein
MAVTLKEETILNEWGEMVKEGAGNAAFVLDAVQAELTRAKVPGDCEWEVEEVKSSTWIARVRREFLIVKLAEFKDYRMYIAARDYGIHLDCCRFMTVEPGFFKKTISSAAFGTMDALSAPKNILIHQDLVAWTTVVHHAVLDSVGKLLDKLGQDKSKLNRRSKGFLEIW